MGFAQLIDNIELVFCSSMNKANLLSLMNTHQRQTTVNERPHGANHHL
jgi:hypothetical protein